jgi:HSP20 family protein
MSNRNDITTTQAGKAPAATQDPHEQQRAVQPAIDVYETEASITLLADMPGVPRDQLEIQVEGDALLIQGQAQPQIPADLEPLWAEVRVPRYRRSFTLSRELDTSRIEANLKDGVLTLRIPKQAHAQPRRVPVNVG